MELSYYFLGVFHIFGIKPLIVRIGISLPLYQILFLLPEPIIALVQYLLHFVLFFISDKVRRWSGIIGTMELRLSIRGKEVDMEHIVYLPLFWKCQLIIYW